MSLHFSGLSRFNLTTLKVDRHVRILDLAITEQESAIFNTAIPSNATSEARYSRAEREGSRSIAIDVTDATTRSSKRTDARSVVARSKTSFRKGSKNSKSSSVPARAGGPPQLEEPKTRKNAIDMPVLPNEPVYCYCNQVSHGSVCVSRQGNSHV